ncbi:uncharacterized protein LOC103508031 [Diaphorina citri]|uniref:Uncharacterized protein LOC103508031 n=1 Tax=Diaphorina citri TaxID=121845 RepID=A0A3Q0IQM6_DIACI|nr:uncharacterized protein LOC103508031 [Diaphorina citri]
MDSRIKISASVGKRKRSRGKRPRGNKRIREVCEEIDELLRVTSTEIQTIERRREIKKKVSKMSGKNREPLFVIPLSEFVFSFIFISLWFMNNVYFSIQYGINSLLDSSEGSKSNELIVNAIKLGVVGVSSYFLVKWLVKELDPTKKQKKELRDMAERKLKTLKINMDSFTDHEMSIASHLVDPADINVSWEHIAGLDGTIKDLKQTVIFPIKHKEMFAKSKLTKAPKVYIYLHDFFSYVESDFRDLNISCDNCIVHEGCDFPLSSVIINKENGSRTIIHSNRNLPELTAEDFHKLDLSKYCWIHFEGRRNTSAISAMMRRVVHYNEEERSENQPRVRLSVELEKANRTQLLDLIPLCDVSFVGKDFATSQAYSTMSDTIRLLKPSLSPG